jgi:hypothetical protein
MNKSIKNRHSNKHLTKITTEAVDTLSHETRMNMAISYIEALKEYSDTDKMPDVIKMAPIAHKINELGEIPELWSAVTNYLYEHLKMVDVAPYISLLLTVGGWCVEEIIFNTGNKNLRESSIQSDRTLKISKKLLDKLIIQYLEIEGKWNYFNGEPMRPLDS